jgi:hypothetical protein
MLPAVIHIILGFLNLPAGRKEFRSLQAGHWAFLSRRAALKG